MAAWKLPFDVHRDGLPAVVIYISGILSCLGFVSNITRFLLPYLKPSKLHRYLHDTDGKPAWALVTGATDGIGKHFSHELASRGFNVVLHGRNPTKLAAVHDELVRKFPAREFRSLIADASNISCGDCRGRERSAASPSQRGTPVDFDALAASLDDINLTVLINNAGGAPTPVYQFLHETSEATIVDNVNLNAVFPLLLESKLLPQLIRNGPSLIMNIGSFAENGLPMVTPYASSKAFVTLLGTTIPNELAIKGKRDDVEVLGVRVGQTTGTSAITRPVGLFAPDASTMARAALARVGCGRPLVVGYFPHAIQQAVMNLMPQSLRDRGLQGVMRDRWIEEQGQIKKGT